MVIVTGIPVVIKWIAAGRVGFKMAAVLLVGDFDWDTFSKI